MAQLLAQMDDVTRAAGQGFVAGLPAGGDGIGAAPSLRVAQLQEFCQRRLTAGTRIHQAW